jgi:hypothetical protein
MTHLTAAQARELSKLNSPKGLTEAVLEGVKERAEQGKSEFITRQYGFGDGRLYTTEQNYPSKIREVLQILRKLGYKADIFCEERQFVDIYLKVTW